MNERLNDMLTRYGEVCPQKKAAQILSVTPRTIARMMDDGRLRRVGMHGRSLYLRLYRKSQANGFHCAHAHKTTNDRDSAR